jgi:hypothetical protein
MRKRTVELDGAAFVVSPLTIAQTEDHLQTLDALTSGLDGIPADVPLDKLEKIKAASRKFVAVGLNNAHVVEWRGDAPVYEEGFVPWTAERVRAEVDLVMLGALRDAIMELSGMKVREGEAAAVS